MLTQFGLKTKIINRKGATEIRIEDIRAILLGMEWADDSFFRQRGSKINECSSIEVTAIPDFYGGEIILKNPKLAWTPKLDMNIITRILKAKYLMNKNKSINKIEELLKAQSRDQALPEKEYTTTKPLMFDSETEGLKKIYEENLSLDYKSYHRHMGFQYRDEAFNSLWQLSRKMNISFFQDRQADLRKKQKQKIIKELNLWKKELKKVEKSIKTHQDWLKPESEQKSSHRNKGLKKIISKKIKRLKYEEPCQYDDLIDPQSLL